MLRVSRHYTLPHELLLTQNRLMFRAGPVWPLLPLSSLPMHPVASPVAHPASVPVPSPCARPVASSCGQTRSEQALLANCGPRDDRNASAALQHGWERLLAASCSAGTPTSILGKCRQPAWLSAMMICCDCSHAHSALPTTFHSLRVLLACMQQDQLVHGKKLAMQCDCCGLCLSLVCAGLTSALPFKFAQSCLSWPFQGRSDPPSCCACFASHLSHLAVHVSELTVSRAFNSS